MLSANKPHLRERIQSLRDQAFARRCSDNTAQGERDGQCLDDEAARLEHILAKREDRAPAAWAGRCTP